MPQTKPMLWTYFMLLMNFILLSFIIKIHYHTPLKKTLYIPPKIIRQLKMKW